jgi:hypothetical protein
MPESTPLGYPYPESEDTVRAHLDIQALAEAVDDSPGVSPLTQGALDNAGGAQIRNGRVVYNLTAKRLEVFVDGALTPLETAAGAQTKATTAKAGAEATAATALSAHEADTTNIHGIANTANLVTSAILAAHESDTTNIHGIADTAALATKAYADTAAATAAAGVVDSAPSALNTLKELATALGNDASFATSVTNSLAGKVSTSELAAHTSATTSVHGIANTANLVVTTDSRLSNARTPTSHAASHASAGSDPISASSIGAAPTSHSHSGADITSGTVAVGRLPTGTTATTVAVGNHTHPYADTVHTHPYANTVHTHDYSPTSHSHDSFVPLSVVDAAGDLIVGSGTDAVGRLPAGPDGYIMQSVASGTGVNRIAWVDPFGSTSNSANLSNALPQANGTASAGIAVTASRSDHVHPGGGFGVVVSGTQPTTPGGYAWLDTTVEA